MHKKSKKAVALFATSVIMVNNVIPLMAEETIPPNERDGIGQREDILDTEAPVIKSEDITIETGSTFNIEDYYTITDAIDTQPKIVLEIKNSKGETVENLDTSLEGQYTLKIIAEDASGNSSEKTITIDISTPGEQVVKYSIEDSRGNQATAISNITVEGNVIEEISNKITFKLGKSRTISPGVYSFPEATISSELNRIEGFRISGNIGSYSVSYVYKGKTYTNNVTSALGHYHSMTDEEAQEVIRSIRIKYSTPPTSNITPKITVGAALDNAKYNEENGHYYVKSIEKLNQGYKGKILPFIKDYTFLGEKMYLPSIDSNEENTFLNSNFSDFILGATIKNRKVVWDNGEPTTYSNLGYLMHANSDYLFSNGSGTWDQHLTLDASRTVLEVGEKGKRLPKYITGSVSDSTTIDTVAPVITASNININYNGVVDILNGVSVKDNMDGNIPVSSLDIKITNPEGDIVGELDTSEVGTWNVTYNAKDSSGNTSSKAIKVYVKALSLALKVTGDTETISQVLSWEAINGAVDYQVKHSSSNTNTLTLKGNTSELTYNDTEDVDRKGPITRGALLVRNPNNEVYVEVDADDIETKNYYVVEGLNAKGQVVATSSRVEGKITSGLAGYSYVVNNEKTFTVDNIIESEDAIFTFNNADNNTYLHIAGVDRSGNVGATKTVAIKDGTTNTAPVIHAPAKNVIVKQEELDIMKDITAIDFEDGDLTDKIKVEVSNKFNGTISPGEVVTVTYSVTDKNKVTTKLAVKYRREGTLEASANFKIKPNRTVLAWKDAKAESYEIFRQSPNETEMTSIGTSDKLRFEDTTVIDTQVPEITGLVQTIDENGNTRFRVGSVDHGDIHKYYINADTKDASKIINVRTTAPIEKYNYIITENPTESIEVLELTSKDLSEIDVRANEGKYIHVVAEDTFGNISPVRSQLINDRYETNYIPVIHGLTSITLPTSEDGEFDLLEGVTAYDEEDKDLTKNINVYLNNEEVTTLSREIEGNYTVTYDVEDNHGNRRTVDRIVLVQDQGLYYNATAKVDKPQNNIVVRFDKNRLDQPRKRDSEGPITYVIQKFDYLTKQWLDINLGDAESYDETITGNFKWIDPAGKDLLGPSVSDINVKKDSEDGKLEVNISSKDRGVGYTYRVEHRDENNMPIARTPETITNNTVGVAGYSYHMDDESSSRVDGKIKTKADKFKIDLDGSKYLHIAPVDAYGNIGQQVNIELTKDIVNLTPVIVGAVDLDVQLGGYINLRTNIIAKDFEDGDLTSVLEAKGEVDFYKAGSYTIEYTVTDSEGATTTEQRVINVVEPVTGEVKEGTPQVFMYPDHVYILKDTTFDVMSGIKVLDKEDGNITDKVEHTTNLDGSRVGTYIANYTVKDSNNNQVNWHRNITVVEEPKDIPTISNPSTEDKPLVNSAPRIYAEDLILPVNSRVNILDKVTATDIEDGDLIHKVKSYGTVHMGKPGRYSITHKVIDSRGSVGITTKDVWVYDVDLPNGGIPGELGPEGEFVPDLPQPPVPVEPDQPVYPYYPDMNPGIDSDGDGLPDINIDLDDDGILDLNIDTDNDGLPDVNVDLDDDKVADINKDIIKDNSYLPSLDIDTNGDGKGDINVDTDGDGVLENQKDIIIWIPGASMDKDGDGKLDYDTMEGLVPDVPMVPIDPPVNPEPPTDGEGEGEKPEPPTAVEPPTEVEKPEPPTEGEDEGGNPEPPVEGAKPEPPVEGEKPNPPTEGEPPIDNPDINVDTDKDSDTDINIDIDGDKKPDINIDTDNNNIPDINIDLDGDLKPDLNIDTDGDSKPDINIDSNGDGKPDVNVDTNGDGKPDTGLSTDNSWNPNLEVDIDNDGIVDYETDSSREPDKGFNKPGEGGDNNITLPTTGTVATGGILAGLIALMSGSRVKRNRKRNR